MVRKSAIQNRSRHGGLHDSRQAEQAGIIGMALLAVSMALSCQLTTAKPYEVPPTATVPASIVQSPSNTAPGKSPDSPVALPETTSTTGATAGVPTMTPALPTLTPGLLVPSPLPQGPSVTAQASTPDTATSATPLPTATVEVAEIASDADVAVADPFPEFEAFLWWNFAGKKNDLHDAVSASAREPTIVAWVLALRPDLDINEGTELIIEDTGQRWSNVSPLHLAVWKRNAYPVVDLLVEQGADVNITDGVGQSPLHLAVKNNAEPLAIIRLLEAGGDTSLSDFNGHTVCQLAEIRGTAATRRVMASACPDLTPASELMAPDRRGEGVFPASAPSDWVWDFHKGHTPLHLAAKEAGPDAIAKLLDAGANITEEASIVYPYLTSQPVYAGLTPLYVALMANPDPAVAEMLLQRDIGFGPTGDDADYLRYAARNPEPAVLTLLLDRGISPDAVGFDGYSALHNAAKFNPNPQVTDLLLDRGLDVHATTRSGLTPLHLAATTNPNPDVIAALLDRGANFERRDNNGNTPLLLAAERNCNSDIAGLLLDWGADITAINFKAQTALHRAAAVNVNPAVTELLLSRGANLSAKDGDGQTPLHLAGSSNWNPAVWKLLVEKGGDLHALDNAGWTPLVHANRFPFDFLPETRELMLQNTRP